MVLKGVAVLLGILFSLRPLWGQPSSQPTSPPGHYEIRFQDHLKIPGDLKLSETIHSESVLFNCESRWKPVQGSRLHLFFQHSPDLDGGRSFLSITLNYGILRSLRLDEQNEKLTEVVIGLPPELLKQKNELAFSVEQFPSTRSSAAEVWTAVSPRSSLWIQYEEKQPQMDLRLLPSPLLDPYSYRPKKLSLLLPESVSTETLEATALLVGTFSNRVSPEPVLLNLVNTIQSARDPLLIVGTPGEQPQLRALQSRSSFVLQDRPHKAIIQLASGDTLGESDGLVALTTRAEEVNPILIVTGNSGAGVLRTARNLSLADAGTSGNFVWFSQEFTWVPRKPRVWKGYVPPGNRFTLEELGFKALKIPSQNDLAVSIPLNAPPDVRFLDYGHQMILAFKLGSNHFSPDSHLEVRLNQALLESLEVQKMSPGSVVSVPIPVPSQLLKSQNLLKIVWRGSLPERGSDALCWLLPNSEFYLPRDFRSLLPDLGLLQFGLYPFSLRADLSDTTILLPAQISEGIFSILIDLSNILGRMLPTDQLAFQVKRVADLADSQKATSHFISLHVDSVGPPLQKIFPNWKFIPWVETLKNWPAVQETVSPWNPQKYVLNITANSVAALQQAVRNCFSEVSLRQLKGDAAYVTSNQAVCFTLSSRKTIQEYSYLTHVEAWLRVNWMALPIILTVVSGVLFVGLRLALNHYKSSKGVTYF